MLLSLREHALAANFVVVLLLTECNVDTRFNCVGVSQGKLVKIRKTAAHGGLAFGKDSSQKVHVLKQEAKRKQTSQNKQHKRKKAKTQEL